MSDSSTTEQQNADREAERRRYQRERSSKEQEKREAEAAKAAIEQKIERLQEAYSKIHAVKRNAEDLNSGVQRQGDSMPLWVGQRFGAYSNYVDSDFKSYYTTYISDLDYVQDEINREISRLQIQAAEYGNIIDRLWARICQLGRWIQNLFN